MAQPVDRCRGLIDVHDPARRAEVYVEAPSAPADQRVPRLGLPIDERAWPFGPVAGEIGLGVARDAFRESLLVGSDPVDCRIGEPGQRQGAGVYLVANLIPFGRDGFGERLRRDRQQIARGRPQRLAIQFHAPSAIPFDGIGLLPEALHRRSRSCCSQSFRSSFGAKTASTVPTMTRIAPTAGQPPSRSRSV